MLTDEEKARIRIEELFRVEVRDELEKHKPKALRARLWSLANSSFALWFLSSVVVAGATGYFAHHQSIRDEGNRKAEIMRRLDIEISNRISQAIIGERIDRQRILQGNMYPPESIYNNTVYYLNNYFIAQDPRNPNDFSIYTEYQRRNFRSLIFELATLVEPEVLPELQEVMRAYQDIAESTSIVTKPNYTRDDSLAAVEKALHILNTRIMKARWQPRL